MTVACDTWRDKLDAYFDDSLSEGDTREVDGHLRSCVACAGDAVQRLRLKRAVKLAGVRYAPSAEFRRKIEARIAPRRRRTLLAWAPALAALATIALVASGLLWWQLHQSLRARTFREVADLHVATLASANPVDVLSSERHTVKPWFAGKLPFSFNLPELQNTGFALVGGRLAYFEQSPAAHLLFQAGQHRVSVFVVQDRGPLRDLGTGTDTQNLFTTDTWSENGLRYFAISDASPEAIHKLSEMLRQAQKQ